MVFLSACQPVAVGLSSALGAPKGAIAWLSRFGICGSKQLHESKSEAMVPSSALDRLGFPRQYRLTKTDEYSSVFGFRKALKSQHFLLHYRIRASSDVGDGARLGLVIAKRLLRRAIDRNLIRRLARESFRVLRPRLMPRDLVLRLVNRPDSLDRKALAKEIRNLMQKTMSNPW